MTTTYFQRGLTLIEVLIVLAIVSIVVKFGAPSVVDLLDNMTHKSVVEEGYFKLQFARSSAISSGIPLTVSFETATPWCVGLSDAGVCDCHIVNSCTVNGVEQLIRAQDYKGIVLQEINFGGNTFTQYDGQRGMALNNSGSFVLAEGTTEARVQVNDVGRVSVCMEEGQLGSYQSC